MNLHTAKDLIQLNSAECPNLIFVTFANDNAIRTIVKNVFYMGKSHSLDLCKLNSLESIGIKGFYNCQMTVIDILKSIKIISDKAC